MAPAARIKQECDVGVAESDGKRIAIAVSFGVDCSSVAYSVLKPHVAPARTVKCIANYPGHVPVASETNPEYVPTALWYRGHLPERAPTRCDAYVKREGSPHPGSRSWGFEVQRDCPEGEPNPLARFSVMLHPETSTGQRRLDVGTTLCSLRRQNIIQTDEEVYKHYLTDLLTHAREQLHLSQTLEQDMPIQFTLCVPAERPSTTYRVLLDAFTNAVKEAGFGERGGRSAGDTFLISEPEAIASCVLAEAGEELYHGECITIVSAEDGAVHAATYRCCSDDPLRLSADTVAPIRKFDRTYRVGEAFKRFLFKSTDLLRNEAALGSAVAVFQKEWMAVDPHDRGAPSIKVPIGGSSHLEIPRTELMRILFSPLRFVTKAVVDQLRQARRKRLNVQMVVLTGRLSRSRILQSDLRQRLPRPVQLVVPEDRNTTVARGGVLRGLDDRLSAANQWRPTSQSPHILPARFV